MKTWTVDDVMTRTVVSVFPDASYRNMVDLLIEMRFSALPVIDADQHVVGVVSEADLLRKIEYAGASTPRIFDGRRRRDERRKAAGRTAADLMTTPPVTARSGMSIAGAARLMDDENVKRLPIVDGIGRLIGIVSRADLLKTHLRSDRDILADIERNVLSTFLVDEAVLINVAVVHGVVTLSGQADRRTSADLAARLSRQVAGVVEVTSTVTYRFDDRRPRAA